MGYEALPGLLQHVAELRLSVLLGAQHFGHPFSIHRRPLRRSGHPGIRGSRFRTFAQPGAFEQPFGGIRMAVSELLEILL